MTEIPRGKHRARGEGRSNFDPLCLGTENTPARSGVGEGPAAHGWPGRGEAPNFASGNGAFNNGGQGKPAQAGSAPRGLWPVGWGRLITTVCSPQSAGRGFTPH